MNQELAVRKWNQKFRPGTCVEIREKGFKGITITAACIRDEEAKVYVDGLVGPVPLRMVTPIARAVAEGFYEAVSFEEVLLGEACILRGKRPYLRLVPQDEGAT